MYKRQKQEFCERQPFSQACGHDSGTVREVVILYSGCLKSSCGCWICTKWHAGWTDRQDGGSCKFIRLQRKSNSWVKVIKCKFWEKCLPLLTIESPVAQWLEHPTRSQRVVGLNPILGLAFFPSIHFSQNLHLIMLSLFLREVKLAWNDSILIQEKKTLEL